MVKITENFGSSDLKALDEIRRTLNGDNSGRDNFGQEFSQEFSGDRSKLFAPTPPAMETFEKVDNSRAEHHSPKMTSTAGNLKNLHDKHIESNGDKTALTQYLKAYIDYAQNDGQSPNNELIERIKNFATSQNIDLTDTEKPREAPTALDIIAENTRSGQGKQSGPKF